MLGFLGLRQTVHRRELKGVRFPSSRFQLNMHFSESLPHPCGPTEPAVGSNRGPVGQVHEQGHICLLRACVVVIAAEKKDMQTETRHSLDSSVAQAAPGS